MATTLIVDWLGRGGVAQTTEAWAMELEAARLPVSVVTRAGRELAAAPVPVLAAPRRPGRLGPHQAVVATATRAIDTRRPDVVVIQNHVLPQLEWPVHAAARRAGAKVVFVVHDHRLHTRMAGSTAALRRELRLADVVVAHSEFVADGIRGWVGRADVELVPHPVPLGLLLRPGVDAGTGVEGDEAVAVHFGVLRRSHKGTSTVVELARRGVPGWRFVLLGDGAPVRSGPAEAIPGFVEAGVLTSTVARSDATVLPYRLAAQSGSVVLAQALGSVVVVSAVGGIPDQVDDGVDGRLLRPGASVEEWALVLSELGDAGLRRALARAARRRVWEAHRQFAARVRDLSSSASASSFAS